MKDLAEKIQSQRWFLGKNLIQTSFHFQVLDFFKEMSIVRAVFEFEEGVKQTYVFPFQNGFCFNHKKWVEWLFKQAKIKEKAIVVEALDVDSSNVLLRVNGRLLIKMYPLIQDGIHPEWEVLSVLQSTKAMVPRLLNVIETSEGCFLALILKWEKHTRNAWEEIGFLLNNLQEASLIELAAQLGKAVFKLHKELKRSFGVCEPSVGAREAFVEGIEKALLQMELTWVPPKSGVWPLFQRIHGDLHLGQVLWSAKGVRCIIDFEGEPLAELSRRRAKMCFYRDLAGILRSFDYALHVCLHSTEERDLLRPMLEDAFLGAFNLDLAQRGELQIFELHRAIYEVEYERSTRPGWEWIPLSGVKRLIQTGPQLS